MADFKTLIAYFIEVIPISIVRLIQWGSKGPCPNVRPGWVIFTVSLLGASGFINAVLWMVTGRRFGFRTRREIEARRDRLAVCLQCQRDHEAHRIPAI